MIELSSIIKVSAVLSLNISSVQNVNLVFSF